jgi:hypothetical protein
MLHGNFHSCRLAPSEIKVHQNQSFERYPELFTNLTIWGAILHQGMNLKRVNLVFLPFFSFFKIYLRPFGRVAIILYI